MRSREGPAASDGIDRASFAVARAGATMEQIVRSIDQVTTIMAEIAAASEEQSAGIEQVNTALVEMDRVTQQNAALVEEAAAAADAMREQASQLASVVATFRLAQSVLSVDDADSNANQLAWQNNSLSIQRPAPAQVIGQVARRHAAKAL